MVNKPFKELLKVTLSVIAKTDINTFEQLKAVITTFKVLGLIHHVLFQFYPGLTPL